MKKIILKIALEMEDSYCTVEMIDDNE